MSDALSLSKLGQIAMPVEDLDRATAFYRDTLGVRFLFAVPNLSFFDLDGVRLMLAPPEGAEERQAGSVLYFDVSDLTGTHAALAERGVTFVGEPHRVADMGSYELWMAFFHDSEGNLLALMSEVTKG